MKSCEGRRVNAEEGSCERATIYKVGAKSTAPEDYSSGEIVRIEVVEIAELWRRKGG
jgi:hypothetical protein